MKAVKIVIAERKQVAERAAEADPETWEQLRENIDVETGIRAQIGSEKKGRVRRAAPSLEAEQDMSEKEYLQLLGISRPGKAVPGQPQRPMRKAERTEFRRNLQAARQAIVAAKHQAIEDELTASCCTARAASTALTCAGLLRVLWNTGRTQCNPSAACAVGLVTRAGVAS